MVGLGKAMLDAVALAGAPEDVADPSLRDALIAIDEQEAFPALVARSAMSMSK